MIGYQRRARLAWFGSCGSLVACALACGNQAPSDEGLAGGVPQGEVQPSVSAPGDLSPVGHPSATSPVNPAVAPFTAPNGGASRSPAAATEPAAGVSPVMGNSPSSPATAADDEDAGGHGETNGGTSEEDDGNTAGETSASTRAGGPTTRNSDETVDAGTDQPMPPGRPCPVASTITPGDTPMTLTVDGTERSFLVHAPPSYDGQTRLPVVFDFHGLTGNSNQQKNLSRWQTVGDREGFIVVYPQGLPNGSNQPAWSAGLCCSDESDDVAFVRAIVSALEEEACIDSKRVYASGCSNGGGMSYRLACEAADLVAAVAPVDFDCVVGAGCGDCAPSRPVTVVQFRGTKDTLVVYEGSGAFAGAQNNLATWSIINECMGAPEPLQQTSACEAPPTCGSGAETILCTVQDGTHCGSYASFMIPDVAWEVFERHVLP